MYVECRYMYAEGMCSWQRGSTTLINLVKASGVLLRSLLKMCLKVMEYTVESKIFISNSQISSCHLREAL